jgi:hypothetical protein
MRPFSSKKGLEDLGSLRLDPCFALKIMQVLRFEDCKIRLFSGTKQSGSLKISKTVRFSLFS